MSRDLTHCFVKIPVKPLDEASLNKVHALEKKLGCQLIAFGRQSVEYAKLATSQMKEIDELGKEIDADIVAYSYHHRRPSPPSGC